MVGSTTSPPSSRHAEFSTGASGTSRPSSVGLYFGTFFEDAAKQPQRSHFQAPILKLDQTTISQNRPHLHPRTYLVGVTCTVDLYASLPQMDEPWSGFDFLALEDRAADWYGSSRCFPGTISCLILFRKGGRTGRMCV